MSARKLRFHLMKPVPRQEQQITGLQNDAQEGHVPRGGGSGLKSQPSRRPFGEVVQVPSAGRCCGAARMKGFCPQTWAKKFRSFREL
jgi:hypothetical protein